MDETGLLVEIQPWEKGDLLLLRAAMGTEQMTEHVGGPETDEQIAARHERYLSRLGGAGQMYKIVLSGAQRSVGTIGFWARPWRGETVFEIGWRVLPPFQGRGVATAAVRAAIEDARADGRHNHLHAFPAVENEASNAICRKVGFVLLAECDFEYPPGRIMRANDWALDLNA